MKLLKNILLLLILLTFSVKLNAQDRVIDSLKAVLKTVKDDTDKVNVFNELCNELRLSGDYERALQNGQAAYKLGQEINFQKGIAISFKNIGSINLQQGNYKVALEYYSKSLKIAKKHKYIQLQTDNLGNMGMAYMQQGDYEKALELYLKAIKIDEEQQDKKGLVADFANISNVYWYQSNYSKALEYNFKALSVAEELKDKDNIARVVFNIANVYADQGNYPLALEYYFKALYAMEDINNKDGIATIQGNIGTLYKDQSDYPKALDYYFKALKIKTEIGNKDGIAANLGNIGTVYHEQDNFSKALEYIFKSLKISEELGDMLGIAINYNNIASVYSDQGYTEKALEYYFKSLKIREEIEDKNGIITSLNNIGGLYTKQKKYVDAEKYLIRALLISKEIGTLDKTRKVEEYLSQLYFEKRDYKKAYEHYRQYSNAKDSLFNIEKYDDLTRKEMNYEYDKKEAIAKVEKEKQVAVATAESKKQKIIIWSVESGLLLVVAFAVFIFRSLRSSQKQKRIIENQKHLVEEKHKEISDSINYAERIQRALLASKNLLDENLSDYFILFKPKDVVSGDFYWAASTGSATNKKFILVTADSTGHGVPGAIMSILNIACLKEAVSKGIISPDLLLNETRSLVIENLKNDGSLEGGKDGMDGSLLSIDFKTNIMYCALANNPIWVIRTISSSPAQSSKNTCELIEIKADRMPIGKHDKDNAPFTLHTLNLQKGDVVYMLTDGFPDQFGGANGKKFKYKQLQELLLSISHEPMEIQKQKLDDVFNNWRGNLEQVDDVTIIGIRI